MEGEQTYHQADAHPPSAETDTAMSGAVQCAFLRLPAEIRVRIYEYVLIPEPTIKIPCSGVKRRGEQFRITPSASTSATKRHVASATTGRDADTGSASVPGETTSQANSIYCVNQEQLVEGRLVGSTCELKPCSIKDIQDDSNRAITDIVGHIGILATNKQIFNEAAAVLYGNCRVGVREPCKRDATSPHFPYQCPRALASMPLHAMPLVRNFHLEIDLSHLKFNIDEWRFRCLMLDYSWILPRELPNLKIFSIHIDIDLTWGGSLDAADFEGFYQLAEQVEFVIDIHITKDWDGCGTGWEEPIHTYDIKEEMVACLNQKAQNLRDTFVQSLSEIFTAHGKKLRIAGE